MKKYLWTLSVMALFAIGFAASDDDSSNSSSSSSSQTEQIQETEAEREMAKMKKELVDYARKEANGIANYSYSPVKGQPIPQETRDRQCQKAFLNFLQAHSASTTDENMQLYGEFKKAWDEEYDKVEAAKRTMEKF